MSRQDRDESGINWAKLLKVVLCFFVFFLLHLPTVRDCEEEAFSKSSALAATLQNKTNNS